MKERLYNLLKVTDIPLLCFSGTALGAMMTSFMFIIFSLGEADEGYIWSWICIARGFMCLGYSIVVSLIATAYWWFVVRKSGIFKPALTGFGVLLGALSLLISMASCVVAFFPLK